MKAKIMAVVAATLVSGPAALAASPTWVDWTSTTSGTMGTTAVTLAGPADWLENGTYYYDNSATTTPPANTYAGLNPFDVIGVTQTGTFTLTFSQAVGSLYMSLVSVGNGGEPVTYQFSDPFTVVSSGPNYWGIGEFDVVGNNFTGIEYNGILKLSGDFGPNHPLIFTVQNPENWHGFNVAAVPEPETYAMMMAGLGMIGVMARRRKRFQ